MFGRQLHWEFETPKHTPNSREMASVLPHLLSLTVCIILMSGINDLNPVAGNQCPPPSCNCEIPELPQDSNLDLKGLCLCPEHGIFPSDIVDSVVALDLRFEQPVVLGNASFPTFKQLWTMNISGVQFVLPDGFRGLKHIHHLLLHNNFMRVLEKDVFDDLENLRKLTVVPSAENKVHALENGSFIGLRHLQTLILKGNSISVIKGCYFRDLSEVTNMDLSQNELTQIEPESFLPARKLTDLNLNGNSINLIKREAFLGLTMLRFLRLEDNLIQTMPMPVFQIGSHHLAVESNSQRVTVFLDGNRIRCGCQLNWISEWLDIDGMHCEGVCTTPAKFQDHTLSHVYTNSLSECLKNGSTILVKLGDRIELHCPEQQTTWVTPEGYVLQDHGEYHTPYSLTNIESLVIWKVSPENTGKFSCLSSDGSLEYQYEVTIQDNSFHKIMNTGELVAVIMAACVVPVAIIILIVKCRNRKELERSRPSRIPSNVQRNGVEPEPEGYQRDGGARGAEASSGARRPRDTIYKSQYSNDTVNLISTQT